MKKFIAAILTFGIILTLVASLSGCSKNNVSKSSVSSTPITIGSKDFTENLIVAEVYADALEDHGYTVNRKFNIGSSVIQQAITSGQIDLYPEYTGTGLLTILKHSLVTDPKQVYDIVKSEYKTKFNIVWLNASPANDSQGLVILKSVADKYGIKTISDLQKNAGKIRFASQGEFDQRADGLPALEKVYGPFKFASDAIYDNSLKYQILSQNKADLAVAYTTEGQLVDSKYLVLEDDKHVWPPYNLAPIIRQSALDKNPGVAGILNQVSALIDTTTITALNAKVDVDKQEYEDVAKSFYDSIKSKIKG
jgi:osmoprotectant transport system substrate-binding protein